MFDKIKNSGQKLAPMLRDVRALGLVVFAVLVLLVSWSSVNVIQSNYELQKQVARLEQQNQVQKLANTNLSLKNEYYKTDDYLELTARRQFGKAAPGETVVIVPEAVALKYTVPMPKAGISTDKQKRLKKPFYQRNFEAWIDFLWRRRNLVGSE